VNRDGCGDIFVAGWGAASLVLGNPGAEPTFSAHLAYGAFGQLQVADFNIDGLPDVAFNWWLSGALAQVRLLINRGAGEFSDQDVLRIPTSFFLAAGDLDGDGRPDIAATSYTPSGLSLLHGNGDGTFGVREWFDRDIEASALTTGDVNHDGALDLLVLATTARNEAERDTARPSLNVLINRPLVSITTSNTAERWAIGSVRRIQWRHALPRGTNFRVEVSRDNGVTWEHIAASIRSKGSPVNFNWTVTGPPAARARLRVSALGVTSSRPAVDANDASIEIGDPFLRLLPIDNLDWAIGSTQTIRWTHNLGLRTPVTLELSRDNGRTWSTLADAEPQKGTESSTWRWTVTAPATGAAKIRVRASAADVSDTTSGIALASPFLRMSPINPAEWNACELRTVRWMSNLGPGEPVVLQVSIDGKVTWEAVGQSTTNKTIYAAPERAASMSLRRRRHRLLL
jgi:hypothetical protein